MEPNAANAANATPSMPWKLEMHPRSNGEMMPWLVLADGMRRCATAEEVRVWEYVESLRLERSNLQMRVVEFNNRQAEMESAKAQVPSVPKAGKPR